MKQNTRILCGAMAAAMTVSGCSASVSDSFSEYKAAKS